MKTLAAAGVVAIGVGVPLALSAGVAYADPGFPGPGILPWPGGGLGGPASGLGVLPGIGVGGAGGPASGLGVLPGVGLGARGVGLLPGVGLGGAGGPASGLGILPGWGIGLPGPGVI
ncbi:hypothetical protein H7K04_27110 [Mycolicibacterium fluoranthenivorans]|nr:hypothetical protein [Mycolicibacterium fluoranthenivorans]